MRCYLLPIYVGGAALFTFFYWQRPYNSPGVSLAALTNFSGATPYQYRVLMPLLARGLSTFASASLVAIYAALTFAFALGLLYAWRAYLQTYMQGKADFYALALLYPLLWNYVFISGICYPWDIPAMFFFVAGVALIQRERWPLYHAAFFLACLNRETSCFLIIAFVLLTRHRQTVRWTAINVFSQCAIWLAVKLVLTHIFANNPGAKIFENHLASNLIFLHNALTHPLESADWLLLTFGWMIILTVISFRALPPGLKRLLPIAPLFLAGMILAGDFAQARIHNELVPVLLAPALWNIEKLRCDLSQRV